MDEYLTIQEVADVLTLSERRVYGVAGGYCILGVAKVGGSWCIHRRSLEKFRAEGGDAGKPKARGGKR